MNNFLKNISKSKYILNNFSILFPLENESLIFYKIYKYDPFYFNEPWIQTYIIKNKYQYPMLLDNLFFLKDYKDESLSFRRSCREGICGSCAMNINGENTLACIYIMKEHLSFFFSEIKIYPLPHMAVIKDLIVCMKHFYLQYKSINPFLKKKTLSYSLTKLRNLNSFNFLYNITSLKYKPKKENIQYDRYLLNGLYECILCACCSTSCPSYWWNKDRYLGPAVLLQSYRWIIDSRDEYFFERLDQINDVYKIGRCHSILNCISCCPKGLNPAEAINNSKTLIKLYENE